MTERKWNNELKSTRPLMMRDIRVSLCASHQYVELTDTSMQMTVSLSYDQVEPLYDWLGKVLGK